MVENETPPQSPHIKSLSGNHLFAAGQNAAEIL